VARFHNGDWFGTYYKVRPLGWRNRIPFMVSFPYSVDDKIKFSIKVTEVGKKQLNELDIYETLPGSGKSRLLEKNKELPNDSIYCKFDDESYMIEGEVKYTLGNPQKGSYIPLMSGTILGPEYFWTRGILPFVFIMLSGVIGIFLEKLLGITNVIIEIIQR